MDAFRADSARGEGERPANRMKDELNEPLGRDAPRRKPASSPPLKPSLTAIAAALVAAIGGALYFLPRDPYSGEPHAVARIEPAKPPIETPPAEPVRTADATERASAAPTTSREQLSSTTAEIEQSSGVKVTRRGADASGAKIIRIETPVGISLTPAPDRRITEKGPYGPLPRVDASGARPMDVYARPFVAAPTTRPDAPKIALVVGGVGLNAVTTAAAIDELPEAATLAFAPYGADLQNAVARARERGHEALLQAPMEPFDYPQNNPGPHTLLTSAADGGLDDLHWLMSRFSGYAGVLNHLGGRFTASETALTPVLADLARRGVFFLDDGASPQSLATTVAAKVSLPAARVDVVLDARGTPQSLDAALVQLEALARQRGVAIGFVNATPATITRLARFAKDAERRGMVIAPVSATLRAAAASAALDGQAK